MLPRPGLGGDPLAIAPADDSDIVGQSAAHPSTAHAVLWRAGQIIDLGTLGGRVSSAAAVNNRGQIVGESLTSTRGEQHAFLWQRGTMIDLGTLGGTQSAAVAINDAGQVIGTSTTRSGTQHTFLWRQGKMRDLGSLAGQNSTPTSINARGDIVGYLNQGIYDPDHAVLWQDTTMHDLGPFGSKVKQAIAINSARQILVSTFRPDMHAYLWQNGRSIKIWPRYTSARSMNSHGWIVGTALFRKRGTQTPFVWHSGTMTALPTLAGLGPPTSAVYAINDHNWIVGRSYNAAGDRAVLWTPT
jgi:probable HAF family extracellular repeat protein